MTNTAALTDHIREANELMLHQHGANHLGAGYTRKAEEAWLQYALMMDVVRDPADTGHVLDLGCGFAHLLDYIRATPKLAHLTYTGVDLSAEFLAAAQERHPEADLRCLDLLQDASKMPEVDYVIMNGVFNYRGEIALDDMLAYWEKMVLTAFRFARKGIAFNVMSKHVDWERDDLFHLPLDRMAGFVKTNLSRHFVIRHDYPAYEYTTFVYRRPWEPGVKASLAGNTMTRTQEDGDDTVTGKVGLTARGRKLLSHLRVAQDTSGLDDFGLPSELIEGMVQSGFLELQGETMPPVDYQDVFAGWKSQRGMLIDHIRTLAFRDAITAVVQPGDRVVDVGTGSGILAMMAARQGAAEVYALEVTDMASWAARIAEKNGLSAMRVLRGDAAAFEAPGPVDVIMGEFAGMYFVEEWRHYAAFVKVRDRTLRAGGAVIPHAARLYLSAIDSRKLYQERGYGLWEAPFYGLDFSDVLEAEIAAPRRYIISADHNATVCTREIAAFDFLTGTERDYFFTTDVEFPYAAAGSCHGFIGHFELDMAAGKVLSTGTAERETCWHHSYFPLPCIQVPAGGRVAARVRTFLEPQGNLMCVGLTIAGPDETLEGPGARMEHVYVLE